MILRRLRSFLLHGVTGSGKTQMYIARCEAALSPSRSAIMLVPEIALTPFSRADARTFGDLVAIFHSSLQRGERFDEWAREKRRSSRRHRHALRRFRAGQKPRTDRCRRRARSSYRQQESPYYNAPRRRDRARTERVGDCRARLRDAFTRIVSQRAQRQYTLVNLPERIGARPMAAAKIVDMRAVFARHGKPRVFSDELLEAIRDTRERGEQSIILLNRRGYSSFILCRSAVKLFNVRTATSRSRIIAASA